MPALIALIPISIARLAFIPLLQDPNPPTIDLPGLTGQLLTLGGYAALVAALINAGKKFGLIKDGQAPAYSLILNVIGLVVLALIRLFAPQTDITATDGVLETIAQVLIYALSLAAQLGITKTANVALRGAPVVGYSHSEEKEKAADSPPAEKKE